MHPGAVARALWFAQRYRLKRLLGIPSRPCSPVLEGGMNSAVERYRRICRTLLASMPNPMPSDFTAAEIGFGDCLASADMMLGLGAHHIHLVEHQALPLSPLHLRALEMTRAADLPNQARLLLPGEPPKLNPSLATLHAGLLEKIVLPSPVDLVYSFDVLEHVENLPAFFTSCHRMLKPGRWSLHKFDLSGHEFFEDPMPPLDFQTYPRWLYRLMFPRYRRAVGNFADQFVRAMKDCGFEILRMTPLRQAEASYLTQIRPQLRPEARARGDEVLGLLDLVILAQRPLESP